MSNSTKVLAEEHPIYFLCSRRDIPQLVAKAEEEAAFRASLMQQTALLSEIRDSLKK